MTGPANIPRPANEPVRSYAPGTAERASLKAELARQQGDRVEIPVVINGERIRTGATVAVTSPHDHQRTIATLHLADATLVQRAADGAVAAQREWASWRYEDRASVLLKAAELLATRRRDRINAATMLGQSKTAHQAEIDAACELADFFRFNAYDGERLQREQPGPAEGVWNRLDHRPLEGFVYAVTPFNFTAIAGNLPSAPALLGNVAVWKPTNTAALSNWFVYELLEEAGLPPGVIQFVPGEPVMTSDVLLAHPMLAGIHFTGSTAVFRRLMQQAASHLDRYRGYPRIVGETGGKDFVLAHASADLDVLVTALIRGAYEYQGQKCSAASRAYIPDTLWPAVRDRLVAEIAQLRVGDVADFRNFMGAVIDERAFTRLEGAIAEARATPGTTILAGGGADRRTGWFVEPTLVQATDPAARHLCDEFFGPLLTVHVYPAARWEETLALVDRTSPYALTGAIIAQERAAIVQASAALRQAAGNLYINDKPTGAIVGQQPFGGARASGTNDKAGSVLNLLRWVSPRTVKETLSPPRSWRYPYLDAE